MDTPHYLPLGSIVLMKGGTKRLMIYGRCQKLAETGEEYDYIGCLYPEGFLRPELSYVFNHSGIAEVVHQGFVDEEEQQLQAALLAHRTPVLFE